MSDRFVVTGNVFSFQGKSYRCAIGKSGFSDHKKEGDGCTPLGIFPLRECWYRADRMNVPETELFLREIHPGDGWCDDPKSMEYNKAVKIPYGFSHEELWRDDHVYDLIIPLGYNDNPVISGKGSAIFLHIAHEDYKPTEGCIALAKDDLLRLLPHIDTNSVIEVKRA